MSNFNLSLVSVLYLATQFELFFFLILYIQAFGHCVCRFSLGGNVTAMPVCDEGDTDLFLP